jgi:signal transduction histidine kinase
MEMKDDLDRISGKTQYLLDFMGLGDEVSRLQNQGTGFHLQHKGNDYVLSVLPAQPGEWILLFDLDRILDLSIKPALERSAADLGFAWEVIDRTDQRIAFSEEADLPALPVRYPLASGLPPWTILFFPGKSGFLDSFLNTGKGIYFFIFLLIIIILAFGLFFTLNTVNQEIRLSKMKSYFISTVSHEFKSPLTSIRQMAEMLDQGRVRTDERRKAYYASMLHQSERLSHLIENILDFARMEDGRKQYQFEPGDLVHVVQEFMGTFDVQLKDQGYAFRFQANGDISEIRFDREAMEQVMHNLLDNAVKYSGAQKRIDVEVFDSKPEVVISVRDYGIGIPKADQEKIFNRFYRAGDALTSRIRGSGIGLTIVRQIVEAHGGKVTVHSRQGQGSTFRLHLPKQQDL